MSFGWSDLTPEGERYFSQLEELTHMVVDVGFQEGVGHGDDEITVAEIAAYNDLGTSAIPPRPFMEQSFENHEGELQDACDQVELTINSGGSCEGALEMLGVFLKKLVQEEIVDGGFAPNSPITIARKGSSQPLIDSGEMRQLVDYVIRQRG